MTAQVHKDGKVYQQTYKKGTPTSQVEVVGETDKQGTTITFVPDETIFDTTEFSYHTIASRLKHAAYLTPGVIFTLVDEIDNKTERFYFE
jgi:DNA gyrase subunit B